MAKLKDQKSKSYYPKRRKTGEKSIGLFDHVKQISQIQDPNYYDNLSDSDKKSFNHFTILKALSMNPDNLDTVNLVYRYFDVIPSKQFYTLLISLIRPDKNFYPWVKSKNKLNEELAELVSNLYQISNKESEEYIRLLLLTKEGRDSLVYICQGFGKSDKEIEKLLSNTNDDE